MFIAHRKFPEVATGHGAAGIWRRVPRMRLVPTLHRASINNRHATFQRGSVLSPLHAGRWELRGYTRCALCRGAAPSPPRHTHEPPPDPVMRKLRGAADPSFIPYAMPEAGQSLSACAGAPQSWAGGKGSPAPGNALPVSAVPPEPGKHSPRNPHARRNVSILRKKLKRSKKKPTTRGCGAGLRPAWAPHSRAAPAGLSGGQRPPPGRGCGADGAGGAPLP